MKGIRHILNVFLFMVIALASLAQTENEIKENAEEFFEQEEYVQATPLYLRLLSLNPKDADYNFRYGTCLLFNSYQKKEAIRYLNFAVNQSDIDPRAFYFHGRALHLNYQFEDAKKSYQKYLSKREKKDKRYAVERQMQMCDNGKRLLSTFTDIIVSEKKEIDNEKFFRLYSNMQTIGGNILVTADFQSKLDKKKGHVPIVHFPPNAKAIYYSSYGDSEATGKDIYIRRRLPDGSWGEPQRLPGDVNTAADEDFPYMHPSGDFLYFSSKGHNSMGGYDVFHALYNPNTNSFGRVENVDFAISSPDDDLFYVVDSLYKNAYFASARQSQNGKLHVYRVRVARVPIQEVIIMGDYLSEINPENKSMSVTVTSNSNGKEVGKIRSNDQGKYSFVFPKGGKYNYEVRVGDNEDVYKFLVEVPFLDEFRPLKQKAIHTTVDGNEIVKIVNLFDERVEGAEALMAEVIRKKAELDVNVDQFDLKELDAQEERNKVLAEMGFRDMSMSEVSDQLEELAITEKIQLEKASRIEANINAEIILKTQKLGELDERIKEIRKKAEATDAPGEKHSLLLEVKRLETEKLLLAKEIESLNTLRDETLATISKPSESGIGKMEMIENQFNSLMSSENEEAALDLLLKNKDEINHAHNNSPDKVVSKMVEESVKLSEEIDALTAKEREMEAEKRRLEGEIKLLNGKLPGAKKKEAARIREEVADKEEELKLVNEVLTSTRETIDEKNKELSILDNNIASIQKAMLEDPVTEPTVADVKASIEQAEEAISTVESSEIGEQIANLEEENPELNPDYVPVDVVVDSQFESIENTHAERTQEIQTNPSTTEIEKTEQLISVNQGTIREVNERIEEIKKLVEDGEGDVEQLNEEKQKLETYREELEEENEQLVEKLKELQTPIDVAISVEDVVEEIVPGYEEDIASIESDPELSEKEKLEQIQEKDESLLQAVEGELEKLNGQIEKDPNNSELLARKDVVEGIKNETEQSIAERAQTINAMTSVASTIDQEEIISDLEEELKGSYTEDKKEIENSSKSPFEKSEEILELEVAYLDELVKKKEDIEKELNRNPEDANVRAEKTAIETMIAEQTQVVVEQRTTAVSQISEEQVDEAINSVDRTYSVDIGELEQSTSPTKYDDIANREEKLQEELNDAIVDKKREIERRYSATAELELAVLERALEESEVRETTARSTTQPVDVVSTSEKKENYINNLREEVFGGGDNTLENTFTTVDELKAQDQMLAYYEAQLEERIGSISSRLEDDPENEELETELNWLEEEKGKVVTKRRTVGISIGELETVVDTNPVDTNPVNTNSTHRSTSEDPELATLDTREQELREELNAPDIEDDQREEIEKELEEIRNDRAVRENEIYADNIDAGKQDNENLSETLEQFTGENDPKGIVEKILAQNKGETEAIEELIDQAEKAKTEEERNYLLNQADTRQEELNNALRETIVDQQREELEEAEDVTLLSREELERRRRTFSVQIGDLTTEIIKVEKQIDEAKKKEIPALETEKARLIEERAVVESKLRVVEERLLAQTEKEPVVADAAIEKEITFNEERQTAGAEEYKEYYNLANEALEVEQQITTLENELKEEQARVNQLLAEPGASVEGEAIQMGVEHIKQIQSDIDRLSIELVQRKYTADQALPSDTEEAMKMQNLVSRGIQPIKTTAIAAALIQMPSNGLAIDENATSPYSVENPIPVGVEAPGGLVYRVQIGAFAKPIPQDLFKEFNPVSGELIDGTNVTRYMAGFFNNSETVVDAREKIRDLGYSDAFVVAYCDGERIQFGEARRREREGTCVPKGENELMVEVAIKTAEKLGLPTTNEVQEVPELTYNQAPGAAEADPIEIKQGLFFTVQIGVFNRPVGSEYMHNMDELLTIRLPNGQIRYASGVFNSVEEALPRRDEALNNGVKGAFVTAYYKGERITLSEARRLLEENGESILQSEIEKIVEEPVVETPVNVIRTDTVSTINITPVAEEVGDQHIQIVTKKQFDEFPRDVLNRYNAEGNFFFDGKDGRVKSIVYHNEDDLPRLWNFKDDIDTVYLSADELALDTTQILEVKLTDSVLPGDFIDWLMRFNYRKEFVNSVEGRALRIFGVEPNEVQKVQGIIRKFALEAIVVEEMEYELEFEEH